MTKIEHENGKMTEEYYKAQQTKRRLMMIPFLPVVLIRDDVLDAINDDWKEHCGCHGNEFHPVINLLKRTYTGWVKRDGKYKESSFPPELWSICGRKIRMNNAAESVHSRLNKKTRHKISVVRFLMIIDEEMRRTTTRISEGCVSATNAVEEEKNKLFSLALAQFHSH